MTTKFVDRDAYNVDSLTDGSVAWPSEDCDSTS